MENFVNEYHPTILIVDDEKINIDYIVNSLDSNFKIKITTDSRNVFKILEKTKIDLILLDIQMPNIDGFEVANKLKDHDDYKNIPYIFLTSQNDSNSIVEGFNLGAIDYVTKPFNQSELKARIYTHINNFILQQRVKEQQKKLLSQSKFAAIGEMTSMLAHQWRQPLNIISLLVQEIGFDRTHKIFTDDEFVVKKNQLLTTIEDLSKTIETFSRYYDSNDSIKEINILHCINQVKDLFADMIETNNINLNINYEEKEDIYLKSSSKEIKQIFINLIQNSIEAIINDNKEKDFYFVNINLTKKDSSLELSIEDNGCGIKDEIKDTLFEPYISTKENLNGPGLGLFTIKMLLESQLKGSIKVTSKENATIFTLHIKG